MSEINDAAVEAGVAGVQERIAWASLHWGPVRKVDASAWPHIVRAALTAALPHLPAQPAPEASRDDVSALLLTFLRPPKNGYGSWTYSPDEAADALLARFVITERGDR